MTWSPGVQVQGLQARQFRQVLHDEQCRPILEEVAARSKRSLTVALDALVAAGIPAPGGKQWHRMAVWKIARRLGLEVVCGRPFGEFPRCRKCGRQVGRYYGADFCLTCRWREERRETHRNLRASDLRSAEEKVAYYREQVREFEKALESGGRHPSRHRAPCKAG